MKFFVLFAVVVVAKTAAATGYCRTHEIYSHCGNLCEDTCANNCDPSVTTPVLHKTGCVAGCYCKWGYIRNANNECVLHVPGVCSPDRCGSVSPNAIYMKCASYRQPTCFLQYPVNPNSSLWYFNGRCMCAHGYKMNTNGQCIKSYSYECYKEIYTKKSTYFLATPDSCSQTPILVK